jgi:hypothetical protein
MGSIAHVAPKQTYALTQAAQSDLHAAQSDLHAAQSDLQAGRREPYQRVGRYVDERIGSVSGGVVQRPPPTPMCSGQLGGVPLALRGGHAVGALLLP